MSAGISAAVWSAVAGITAVVGTGYAVHAGEQGKNRAQDAARDGRRKAQKQKALADQEFNRENQREANTLKLRDKAAAANGSGVGSTLLTGSSGAGSGKLGSTSLLGG